eukprot:13105991-Alexandrium_andersonii.AAC.1
MSASLVGSEMCIRDRSRRPPLLWVRAAAAPSAPWAQREQRRGLHAEGPPGELRVAQSGEVGASRGAC